MIFPKNIVDYEYDCAINNEAAKIKLSDIKTKYIILIFYPLDFTFVCPTELKKLSDMNEEFLKEDATILFISGDSVYSHIAWCKMPAESDGIGNIKCPMISDCLGKLSKQFNLFNEETGTVMRSTVILSSKNLEVLHMSVNIDPIGRSSSEILRLVKALSYYDEHGEVCFIDFKSNE